MKFPLCNSFVEINKNKFIFFKFNQMWRCNIITTFIVFFFFYLLRKAGQGEVD